MKENKRPAVKDSADHDLDDFVTKPGPSKKARFAKPSSKKQMSDLEKGPVMLNTDKSIAWALRPSLTGAMREINVLLSKQNVLLLQNPDSKKLNYWLSHFIVEAIGEPYPARMHYLLPAGLLRYGHSKSKFCSNFMDKNDPHFDELSGTRDSIAQQLCKDSVGASVKHAAIVTPEEETLLLDKGIMGIYSPKL